MLSNKQKPTELSPTSAGNFYAFSGIFFYRKPRVLCTDTEKEFRLIDATEQYLRGEISLATKKRVDNKYGTDYAAIARYFGKLEHERSQKIKRAPLVIFKFKK